ncbi:MAG TPA: hypothetical protein VKG91_09550 [Roseiarcus sp.]|nr:hypothetical protein [Roseiarcus sp.]
MNDNFIDISFFHELAAYCIQAGSAKRPGIQTLHVSVIYMENAPNLDHFADQLDCSGRGVDPHYPDRSLRCIVQLD